MNLLSRIAGPAIKQLRQRREHADTIRQKLAQFSGASATADNAVAAAAEKFFETMDAEDFDAWTAAQARRDAVLACCGEISRRAGHLADAELQTPEARDLLLTALRDSAIALAREVDALAADEKKRLADAGVEASNENPGLTKLRARVVELRACHADLEGRASWGHCLSRYFAALSLN